ncbi:MAG: nicotinate (nicotinamide) nucleotide adenylyltransferase [Candidatus Pacebacteria bacterium CG_4_10_14_0_8_um_filter_42_14]|nr:MAG: nicotinate (nicotinamide) nucleotide adenylyltransferase [Candidatus Pacebacteria bacterium CG_4_10_14_0_8_um_filter_42_14]
MNIALFGGAFDPPHEGHHLVATTILKEHKVDEVWFLPAREHPFLKPLSSGKDRVAMLELILSPGLKIETFELETDGISYTYKTLVALQEKYPDHNFSFVIGSDNLKSFDKWDEYEELVREFPFFVYPRPGFPMEPLFPNMTALSDETMVTASSTEVRERLARGESISELVEPVVEDYIRRQALYVGTC